ncbi:hypothetical protein TA5114_01791 [Cognatishimia activa]|uniref:50S ribosomal protein L35 n=1 Tax=Cognatishimia activa TaxID=1715691 RepID=A0A0P1IQX6_9RHOB|nr:hypothetical protein TA5113_02235 [Cognatishimia activa]CUK25985.1 hypothetical protein TA5114_01791 [Cognatishimia activa]
MGPDAILTIGLVLATFSVPAFLSAMADGRSTRAASLSVLLAGCAVVYALTTKPGGYSGEEIPRVVIGTLASLIK